MSHPTVDKPARIVSWNLLVYLAIGTFFGIVLIKSEAASWFRIQEMFRFQGFHLYGILISAVLSAALVIVLVNAFKIRSLKGEPIRVADKEWGDGHRHRYWIGGTLFGLGWGLSGTCPGPIYALIGYGSDGAVVLLLSALVGARVYAAVAQRLPG